MTREEIKLELQNKIKEYERSVTVRSLEVITWLNDLIKRIDVEEVKPVKKEIKVELPEEEKKPAPKRKIVFNRKK